MSSSSLEDDILKGLSEEQESEPGAKKFKRLKRRQTVQNTKTEPKEKKGKEKKEEDTEETEVIIRPIKRKNSNTTTSLTPTKKSRTKDPAPQKASSVKKKAPSSMGGPDPIIIASGGDEPSIALVTHDAQSAEHMQRDYLFQALKKIRTMPMFRKLLRQVAAGKPESWAAAVAEHRKGLAKQDQLSDELLLAISKVPDSTCIVIIDRVGFNELEHADDPTWPKSFYNSILHTIDLAQNLPEDSIVAKYTGGGYWQYFKHLLFELCNASQHACLRAIEMQAAKGLLDCATFTLAKELVEVESEDMHDVAWPLALKKSESRSEVLDENDGTTLLLFYEPTLADLIYKNSVGPTKRERMVNAVKTKHTAGYIGQWKGQYAAKFTGQTETPSALAATIAGLRVPVGMGAYFTDYVQRAYNDPYKIVMPDPPPVKVTKEPKKPPASGRKNSPPKKKSPPTTKK
ncbi:hypothetical protein [Nonomuraea sp. NPDC049480]|uniref:hypothetical protein n=1 Tax=Nonomuraea sp. NPDC049480 TaxID=3364353 RepID=UPI0037ABC103